MGVYPGSLIRATPTSKSGAKNLLMSSFGVRSCFYVYFCVYFWMWVPSDPIKVEGLKHPVCGQLTPSLRTISLRTV